MRINKPKLPLNSTPLRARDVQANYYSNQGVTPGRQQENGVYMGNVSPNKLNATKKPQLQKMPTQYNQLPPQYNQATPQYSQMPQIPLHQRRESQPSQPGRPLAMLSKRANEGIECANHPSREGTFKIFIDDEVMIYCQECSNKLSNQGFALQRIAPEINVHGAKPILSSRRQEYFPSPPQMIHPNMSDNEENAPFMDIPNFELNVNLSLRARPRFQELEELVRKCKDTVVSFEENLQGFQEIDEHYFTQQQMIGQFYDAMIDYMKHLKGEHINLLKADSKKYSQIADIESGELEECKMEIQEILIDVGDSANEIIENVDEENFRECMNGYKQKMEMYKHRVDEQRSAFEEINKVEKEELEEKLQQFRSTVNEMFGVQQSKKKPQHAFQNERTTMRTGPNNHPGGMFGSNGNANEGPTGKIGMRDLGGNMTGQSPLSVNGCLVGVGGLAMGMGNINRHNSSGGTLPKGNNNAPFRNLFCDDEGAQSPQFKNI